METVVFPAYTGLKCNMMPFVQGDPASLPAEYAAYSEVVKAHFLELGEIGFLTVHESLVQSGTSQRGYGEGRRTVHVEVGQHAGKNHWGGTSWGGHGRVLLRDDVRVLIANSIGGTCRVWETEDRRPTRDGDLAAYLDDYPENTGRLLVANEVARIGIFTPHECVPQTTTGPRQFLWIVGRGVTGREDYFTVNPLVPLMVSARSLGS